MINIQIGPFTFALNIDGNEVVRLIQVGLITPWVDVDANHVINREKYIRACVVCGRLAKRCECGGRQVLVNPVETQEHLLAHDHDMFHHMTGTTHEGEEE